MEANMNNGQDNQSSTNRRNKPSETPQPHSTPPPKCPRCDSSNTKFCYFNNYSTSQPRYLCKNCSRYWTQGGSLRNVPIGGGSRKNKRSKTSVSASSSTSEVVQQVAQALPVLPRQPTFQVMISGPVPRPTFITGGTIVSSYTGITGLSPQPAVGLNVGRGITGYGANMQVQFQAASNNGFIPSHQHQAQGGMPVQGLAPTVSSRTHQGFVRGGSMRRIGGANGGGQVANNTSYSANQQCTSASDVTTHQGCNPHHHE